MCVYPVVVSLGFVTFVCGFAVLLSVNYTYMPPLFSGVPYSTYKLHTSYSLRNTGMCIYAYDCWY